jgi:hypothetical protein
MPAAVMGDICVCVGPPDTIVLGSAGVMIGGKPAARLGDQCAHGGAITLGCPTVLIGEVQPGQVAPPAVSVPSLAGHINPDKAAKIPSPELKTAVKFSEVTQTVPQVTAPMATKLSRINALLKGAEEGSPEVHKHNETDCKVQYHLLSKSGEPVKGQKYEIHTSDGKIVSGKTDSSGLTQSLSGYTESMCTISFLD